MFPVLQSSPPARELTHRSFSLSKRQVPRPLVVSELGPAPLDVTYSPHRYQSLSIDQGNVTNRFKSPYLYAKFTCEAAKAKCSVTPVPLKTDQLITESTEGEGKGSPDIRTVSPVLPTLCPVCGFELGTGEGVVDRLREEDCEVVKDIKYSLEALRMLRVLGFELNPVSRKLHFQLLQQVQFAVFPLDDRGHPSNLPYFSIYSALDAERKQLRTQFDSLSVQFKAQETEFHRITAELASVKGQNRALKGNSEALQEKCAHLTSEITRLTTTLVQIQSQIDTQEALNTHLTSEIRVKSRVFTHKERANHSLQIHHEKVISDLHNRLQSCTKEDNSTLKTALEEAKFLKSQVKQLNSDLISSAKLYEVMRKCYENDMKAAKEYQKQQFLTLHIDESLDIVKFKQRIKRNTVHYEELSQLTSVNVGNQSFDEVVETTARLLTEKSREIEELTGQVERYRRELVQLEVGKQGLVEEMTELKSRLRYTEMYEENFQLRAYGHSDKFVGLGKTLDVPKYLRCTGFVANLSLSKGQIEAMVGEIWDMKTQWQNRVKKPIQMNTFIYNYLRNKFNYYPKVVEYGYNLMDGAEKYRESPDCDLLLCTLKGELPEAVYHDTIKMLRQFQAYLQQFCAQKRRKQLIDCQNSKETLTNWEILLCVRHFFPLKSAKDLEACRILLDQDLLALGAPAHLAAFNRLFAKEMAVQSHSRFLECLRKQMVMDLSRFYTAIATELLKRCDRATETVTVQQFKQLMCESEPEWSLQEVETRLMPVLGSFLQEESTPLGIEFVLKKLKAGYVRPNRLYDPKAALPL